MTTVHDQWRLDVLSHGRRLILLANDTLDNLNEAHLTVHGVMARAMDDMNEAVSGKELDTALVRSMRRSALSLSLVSD